MSETGHLQAALDAAQSGLDDRRWSRRVMVERFSWQGFLEWWAARRWIRPRDIRKW